jgi:hypothetical protein
MEERLQHDCYELDGFYLRDPGDAAKPGCWRNAVGGGGFVSIVVPH